MNLNEILDIGKALAGVVSLSVFLFFYFTNPAFRSVVNKGITFLPAILSMLQKLVKDKKGEFDTYDAIELLRKVSIRIQTTIQDPANKTFEDVEDEVFEIVRDELKYYQNLPGVPNLEDEAVRVQVKVVFENIQRMMREDPTGNRS